MMTYDLLISFCIHLYTRRTKCCRLRCWIYRPPAYWMLAATPRDTFERWGHFKNISQQSQNITTYHKIYQNIIGIFISPGFDSTFSTSFGASPMDFGIMYQIQEEMKLPDGAEGKSFSCLTSEDVDDFDGIVESAISRHLETRCKHCMAPYCWAGPSTSSADGEQAVPTAPVVQQVLLEFRSFRSIPMSASSSLSPVAQEHPTSESGHWVFLSHGYVGHPWAPLGAVPGDSASESRDPWTEPFFRFGTTKCSKIEGTCINTMQIAQLKNAIQDINHIETYKTYQNMLWISVDVMIFFFGTIGMHYMR